MIFLLKIGYSGPMIWRSFYR